MRALLAWSFVVVTFTSLSCTPAAAAAPPSAALVPKNPAAHVDGPLGAVVDAYDQLRFSLAHDDAVTAQHSAAALAAAAKASSLSALAGHAEALAKVNAGKIDDERAAFSDVSKDFVQLLVDKPALQTGRTLFLCPMAKGYQKWVQTSAVLENPFFGTAMLDCGELQKSWSV
ncbi:MAG TPA: DUF3347 domain-containing protein [Myxococcota bacterium]|jgi:Cu(I)/Ag(I) efflux system membrane fusion protein